MRRSFVIAAGVLILLAFGLISWWTSLVPGGNSGRNQTATAAPLPPRVVSVRPSIGAERFTHGKTNAGSTTARAVPPEEVPPEQSVWEKQVDAILLSDGDEVQKADKLLALLPGLNQEARLEVVQHAMNLLPDESYSHMVQLVTNPATPEPMLGVLMTDLLNRGNELKLPIILNIARTEQHPLQPEARELLEIYLQEDFGNDWASWERALDAWLQENRAEN